MPRRKAITTTGHAAAFAAYQAESNLQPLLLAGDALAVLKAMPSDCIDFAMTSPPYWGKREYENGGIGLEADPRQFVANLAAVFFEVKRVLKPTGSFWLNIGDTYSDKGLAGIPWRVAFELTDNQGWTLRNSVIWNKLKGGMDNSKDRLANVHELVFHFVKQPKGYYYNDRANELQRASETILKDFDGKSFDSLQPKLNQAYDALRGKMPDEPAEKVAEMLVDEVVGDIEAKQKGLEPFERSLLRMPAEVRARNIMRQVGRIEDATQKTQLLERYFDKKIITDKVAEEMSRLIQ
jgi:hypothetical protein